MPPLRVCVVGAGAFGSNHLRVYRELETAQPDLVHLAGFVEPDTSRRAEVAAQYDIPGFASVEDLLASSPELQSPELQAASICVPTLHHAAVAEQLLVAGIDVLIEKPFAASLAEADRICALAGARGRVVAIGHLERFNPAVSAMLAALNRPMFFEAHRLSIFTPRSLDVDVVLDLMIHDLDIVLALTHSPVREVRAVGLPILSGKVDIANVRVEFKSGCVANFTASRVSTERVRKLRLFQPRQYLSLDFARQELLSIVIDPAMAGAVESAREARAGRAPAPALPAGAPAHTGAGAGHPTAGLSLSKADVPKGEPLRLEIEDFLNAVRNRTQPRVTAQAGRAALALALEINAQIASHSQRAGLM